MGGYVGPSWGPPLGVPGPRGEGEVVVAELSGFYSAFSLDFGLRLDSGLILIWILILIGFRFDFDLDDFDSILIRF